MNRKILAVVLISLITVFSFLGQFSFVYADSSIPSASMSEQDMVDAFQAYCKSRDLTIEGSLLDAVTKFTTNTYNTLCNEVGINPTQLQAEISKIYTNQGVFARYAFTILGINGFNRLFAQLLQDNDLQVGDTNVDKLVYSGKQFTDPQGNKCLVFILGTQFTETTNTYSSSNNSFILQYGTNYVYTSDYIANHYPFEFSLTPVTGITVPFRFTSLQQRYQIIYGGVNGANNCYVTNPSSTLDNKALGYPAIFYKTTNQKYYIGTYSKLFAGSFTNGATAPHYYVQLYSTPIGDDIGDDDADVTFKSPVIQRPLPEDEPIDIGPDGTTYDPDDPVVPPSNPDPDPDTPSNPSGWDVPNGTLSPDGDGGFNIDWNFSLPDLNIDWSIDGLINKFPFCIPFDLVRLIQVLNVEPEAPRIQGTVNLLVYQWNVDMDFSRFDSVASLFRNLVFIGFCLGLILITRNLIKG